MQNSYGDHRNFDSVNMALICSGSGGVNFIEKSRSTPYVRVTLVFKIYILKFFKDFQPLTCID
jgi:hypothetical protein